MNIQGTLRLKVFMADTHTELQVEVNKWLKEHHYDISFTSGCQGKNHHFQYIYYHEPKGRQNFFH